jgi:1-deoxyxylulose-5-phosphate synthase
MASKRMTRRQFFRDTATLAAGAALAPSLLRSSMSTAPPTATDSVVLGKTGLRLSRLGFGAGSHSGQVQRNLGHEAFNRLIRYAYDRGITYIDTADGYQTHTWIREAIKGLPREKLFLLTKMGGIPENPMKEIDRYRKELGVDVIDCLLAHCKIKANWDESHKPLIEAFDKAKAKGIIRSHGVSCHSLPALAKAAQLKWVDVNLVRINPQGAAMDTPSEDWNDDSNASHVPAVLEQLAVMRGKGHGIIGMKLIGDGEFTQFEDRERSIRFAMQPGRVDAAVIGFKSMQEIDEAIMLINRALASAL